MFSIKGLDSWSWHFRSLHRIRIEKSKLQRRSPWGIISRWWPRYYLPGALLCPWFAWRRWCHAYSRGPISALQLYYRIWPWQAALWMWAEEQVYLPQWLTESHYIRRLEQKAASQGQGLTGIVSRIDKRRTKTCNELFHAAVKPIVDEFNEIYMKNGSTEYAV